MILWFFKWLCYTCIFIFLCPWDRRSGSILFLSCLSFCPPLWNFNFAYNFWTASARAFDISHKCSLWQDLSFGTNIFYLVTLTLEFDLFFLKTLTLLIAFEQQVPKLWYFTRVLLVTRPFLGYQYFLPCDLDLRVWPIFWKFKSC